MFYKKPKNDKKYQWTNHAAEKMRYYRISESLVKRIVRFPKRIEKGIAPGTVACMQPAGSKKRPSEVWVMYQEIGSKPISNFQLLTINKKIQRRSLDFKLKTENYKLETKKIITAWRYPGVSPAGEPIPIPEEILMELEK